MTPDILAMLIPIFGILGFSSIAIVRIILRADERKLELRLRLKQNGDADIAKVIDDLRAEIASIRDNGSQYDLSLDNTMHRLERRIEHLEGNLRVQIRPAPPEAETVQQVGQNL
ncbi:hypothetical protein CCAX7_49270 [Capsulimonas corticalis]|uniref:Uncharacterized protein n=1 Tax=Capsulimonas corticalis TaxID=2219043 RepID=A0A402CQ47_9BACT|nr:hypothetical protein [Capsulimonas corticalis]BDI32876.1 hypothetical protein CCAX7_49270 [Capsulimonas corticalis]